MLSDIFGAVDQWFPSTDYMTKMVAEVTQLSMLHAELWPPQIKSNRLQKVNGSCPHYQIAKVSAALLNCLMQSTRLPKVTCELLDRICRKFIWGCTEERKSQGCWVYRKWMTWNMLHSFSRLLGLISNKSELLAKTLKAKYKWKNEDLQSCFRSGRGSLLWRSVSRGMEKGSLLGGHMSGLRLYLWRAQYPLSLAT